MYKILQKPKCEKSTELIIGIKSVVGNLLRRDAIRRAWGNKKLYKNEEKTGSNIFKNF